MASSHLLDLAAGRASVTNKLKEMEAALSPAQLLAFRDVVGPRPPRVEEVSESPADETHSAVAEMLGDMHAGLSRAERVHFKVLLAGQARATIRDANATPGAPRALRAILQILARAEPTGVLWQGRLPCMTDELLRDLQQEAEQIHDATIAPGGHVFGGIGTVADRFIASDALGQFIAPLVGETVPAVNSSYIFYYTEGTGVGPHLDNIPFNLLTMLRQSHVLAPGRFVTYGTDGEPNRIRLRPGESVLYHSGATLHAREPLKRDETVWLLSVGFQPKPR